MNNKNNQHPKGMSTGRQTDINKGKRAEQHIIKKAFPLAAALFATMLTLSGCECKHEWAEATCTSPQKCEKCGETNGSSLEHEWVEATCSEQKHCSICGTKTGEKLEHTLSEWTVTKPATCTEAGKQQATCSVCGEVFTEAIPAGHTLGSWEISKEATVSSSGEKIQKCTVCDEIVNSETYYLSADEMAAAEQKLNTAIETGDTSASKLILSSIPVTITDSKELTSSTIVSYQVQNSTNYKITGGYVRITFYDENRTPLTSDTDSIGSILSKQFNERLASVTISSLYHTIGVELISVEFENGAEFSIE